MASDKPAVDPEILLRIERNRQAAIEKLMRNKKRPNVLQSTDQGCSANKQLCSGLGSTASGHFSKPASSSAYFSKPANGLPKPATSIAAAAQSSSTTTNLAAQRPYHNSFPSSTGGFPKPLGSASYTGNQKPNNNNNHSSTGVVFTQLKPLTSTKAPTSNAIEISFSLQSDYRFTVYFKYDQEIVNIFKRIPSKSWDPVKKSWSFALADYQEILRQLKELKGGMITLKEWIPENVIRALVEAKERSQDTVNLAERLETKFIESMYPFQREGVRFAIRHDGRCLIGDDMGLGKTIQAIAVAKWFREDWPLIVICPASLRHQWKAAFLRWVENLAESDICILDGVKKTPPHVAITITSFDIVVRLNDHFGLKENLFYRMVIMDECHNIKSDVASRTSICSEIAKLCRRVILLSGTPALSRPIELFTQLTLLKPDLFPSKHQFGIRYCDAQQKMIYAAGGSRIVWNYKGAKNLNELNILLESTIMIRRLKKDVLKELPPKRREMVRLSMDNLSTKELNQLKVFLHEIKGRKNISEKRSLIIKWFKASADAKIAPVVEYIQEFVQKGTKILLFCHHMSMMDGLQRALEDLKVNHVRIDGSTLSKVRAEACQLFQSNERFIVALLSITACSTGLNLTAANTVIFAEPFWNPGILAQAEDRVHRIGQESDVRIIYLLAHYTIDEFIWPIINKKLSVLNKAGLSNDTFANTINPLNQASDQMLMDEFIRKLDSDKIDSDGAF